MTCSTKTSRWLAAILSCALVLCSIGAEALINGSDDSLGTYSAVAAFGTGCSAVLVAPRVMLTSAHCMAAHALSCTNLAAEARSVSFAEADGGWSSGASLTARTIDVEAFVQGPRLFDLSQCSGGDTYGCSSVDRNLVDHSGELVVLYLAADAPLDVDPLPILIHPAVDRSQSAADVGVYSTLETWVQSEPVVTTVGYGIGSHLETVGTAQLRGRDYGLQRWVEASTDFGTLLGASTCNALAPTEDRPGVVVSPKDLTTQQVGNADTVAAGTDYPGSEHSHSGTGDSGGPVLFGQGIAAKGDTPTAYSGPGTYNPDRNYVAGTASTWVAHGQGELATAFTPTWTHSASTFLMTALHDNDGDGQADPVDDDRDGDGCANDTDQHPDDRWVPVGSRFLPNCSPSKRPLMGDESLHSDRDGVRNCEDEDDDGDGIPDEDDGCPIHAGAVCVQPGPSCPWNPAFFDCRAAGCNELLVKLSSVVNPDPTRDELFRIVSIDERVITIAPAERRSIEQSARLLARGFAVSDARPGSRSQLLTLEVVGPFGRFGPDNVGGVLAVYEPSRVRVIGNLRGANALQLRFGRDGRSLEIAGTRTGAQR